MATASRFNSGNEMSNKKTVDGYYFDGKNSYTLYKDENGKAYKIKNKKQNEKRKSVRVSK